MITKLNRISFTFHRFDDTFAFVCFLFMKNAYKCDIVLHTFHSSVFLDLDHET